MITAQVRAELLKQRSTGTNLGLLVGMLGLVLFAVPLHGLGLAAEHFDSRSEQLTMLLGPGVALGALFAALLGAISFTAEVRHGTIRPTFLVTPRRGQVVAAKVVAGMLAGAGLGLIAAAAAAGAGSAALASRGLAIELGGGDCALYVLGGGAAAALWAAIGVGVGAVVRGQVPAVVGITAWLLFVEGVLAGDILGAVGEVTRFAPGAAAAALSGQDPGALLAPALAACLLALYAAAAAAAGWVATTRRDVI